MTDTGSPNNDIEESPEQEDIRKGSHRRSVMTALAVAVVVVAIVLLLLMLRGCGSVLNSANRRSEGNQIVPVEGGRPIDGRISIWLAAGTKLQDALDTAGVHGSGIVDMGGGRFVVDVPVGEEVDAVRKLRDVDGVHDAGRVYVEPATKP